MAQEWKLGTSVLCFSIYKLYWILQNIVVKAPFPSPKKVRSSSFKVLQPHEEQTKPTVGLPPRDDES
jgi:hypothetical protein